MSSYAVAASERGAWEKTLVAATVDTVTFAADLTTVVVINEGTVGIYFTVDGSAPSVGGATSFYAMPAAVTSVPSLEGAPTVVKLISSGTPKYGVGSE